MFMNIRSVVRRKRVRRPENVAHTGKTEKYVQNFRGETLKERGKLEDLEVNVHIILNWFFKKED